MWGSDTLEVGNGCFNCFYYSLAGLLVSSMLWEFALGVLFELGGVASMTGSTMLGLSRLYLRCVGWIWPRGVMMGGAVPGVLFLVLRRCVRGFVFIVVGAVGFVVVVIGGAIWLTL